PDEDLARLELGQVLDEVRGIVRVHPGEERRRLLAREGAEDGGRLVRVELFEDLRDLLVGQPLEEYSDLGRVEARDEGGPLGRADALGEAGDAVAFALPDQLLDLLEQGIGGHDRHRTALDEGLARRGGWGTGSACSSTRPAGWAGVPTHRSARSRLGPTLESVGRTGDWRRSGRSREVGPWSRARACGPRRHS